MPPGNVDLLCYPAHDGKGADSCLGKINLSPFPCPLFRQHPVQFEITEQTRIALETWLRRAHLRSEDFLFPIRPHDSGHLSIR